MHRFVLQELKAVDFAVEKIASVSGANVPEVFLQLHELNAKVKDLLEYDSDPITISAAGGIKADGIAGLLKLNDNVELEIVPKFLDPSTNQWRSDFYTLAVLLKTGRLLLHDEVSSNLQDRGDLATLVALSLLTQYEKYQRRAIRGYRRSALTDFAIEGDVDWESTVLPDEDGFRLTKIELSRQNPFNATLAEAMRLLIPEVSDVDTENRLRLAMRSLQPQQAPPRTFPILAPRHSVWQQAYELSQLVVSGMGLNPNEGEYSGPGFIISTWAAWESLCEEIVRRALPDHRVVGQLSWPLGKRVDSTIYAKPDISPLRGDKAPVLLDAKYKTRFGKKNRVNAADLYESMAFMRAGKTTELLLLYPSSKDPDRLTEGEWLSFDHIEVDELTIEAFEIQIQGFSRQGGFDNAVKHARAALRNYIPQSPPAAPA